MYLIPDGITNLDRAMHAVVHDYGKRGATELGPLIGIAPSTLSNKVNPSVETTWLYVAEAIRLQAFTKDYRILHAEAELLNHIAVPIEAFAGMSDLELLDAYATWIAEIGDVSGSILEALEDRHISRAEVETIRSDMHNAARAAFGLLARLESLAEV